MQIEERPSGNVMILDFQGKLTIGDGDELLRDKIGSLLQQEHRNMLLNLERVPYIDSAGLGEIVRTYTTVKKAGGSLKLLHLGSGVKDLLVTTKLLTVFESFETEQEAIASFS